MNADATIRRELGQFLKTRRRQLTRAELGLPVIRKGPSGVRREEISYLSGVSITWYSWLEQGREIMPSRQVVDALARALKLSVDEHTYLRLLAGYCDPQLLSETRPRGRPGPRAATPGRGRGFPGVRDRPGLDGRGMERRLHGLLPGSVEGADRGSQSAVADLHRSVPA